MNNKLLIILVLVMVMMVGFSTEAFAVGDLFHGDGTVRIDSNGNVIIDDTDTGFTGIIKKYKNIITTITSVATLTMIVFFIISFGRIGAAGTDPKKRKDAITATIWTAIATGLLGSITTIIALSYGLFDKV